MTVLQLSNNFMVRYEFRLPCKKKQLSKKDSQSADFIRDNINGMRFSDEYWRKDKERWQAMLPASSNAPIMCLLDMAKVSGIDNCLFAYKGGNYERLWLEKANLPSVNLEIFGCPRFDKLVNSANKDNGYYQLTTASHAIPHYRLPMKTAMPPAVRCDMHMRWRGRYPPYRPIHCPASECRVFSLWITRRIEELSQRLEPISLAALDRHGIDYQ